MTVLVTTCLIVTGLVVLPPSFPLPLPPTGLRAKGLTALRGYALVGLALSGQALAAGAECAECVAGDMVMIVDVGEGGMMTLGLRGGGPRRADCGRGTEVWTIFVDSFERLERGCDVSARPIWRDMGLLELAAADGMGGADTAWRVEESAPDAALMADREAELEAVLGVLLLGVAEAAERRELALGRGERDLADQAAEEGQRGELAPL